MNCYLYLLKFESIIREYVRYVDTTRFYSKVYVHEKIGIKI